MLTALREHLEDVLMVSKVHVEVTSDTRESARIGALFSTAWRHSGHGTARALVAKSEAADGTDANEENVMVEASVPVDGGGFGCA